MESRAGGLVRLPGSVGARPEGQSVTGLDFGGNSADVKVQSAEWLRRSGRLAGRLVGAWGGIEDVGENRYICIWQYIAICII